MRAVIVTLIARFTLEQLLWSARSLAALPVAAAPLGVAAVYRVGLALGYSGQTSPFGMFSVVAATLGLSFVAPMLTLFYACGVVSDEVEAGTMPYLLTRPVSRAEILVGKMLGSFVMSVLLFAPSLVLSYYVILSPAGMDELGARFSSLTAGLLAAALGLAAYNGLFAMLGTFLSRPLLAGLFFVFGWQAAASFVPGSARLLTITHYLYALVPHDGVSLGAGGIFGERPTTATALLALGAIVIVTHGLAIWRFGRKEV